MKITVLTGGVGGAKFVRGLARVVDPTNLVAIVNTGDDFNHLGFEISPDIDTLVYTLSGQANTNLGWGRADESWNFMEVVRELGGADWFQLGDRDLALHAIRSLRLNAGETLSSITADVAKRWGIGPSILPMTDDRVRTKVDTSEGLLDFQRYFVARQCEPAVRSISFEGAEVAEAAPGVVEAIAGADAILIAPSNPYLSVDPLFSVPAIRNAMLGRSAPCAAVSPLVGGGAVKGPTAKLMAELGLSVTNETIAEHYTEFVDGLLIHETDGCAADFIAIAKTDTLMHSDDDKERVARVALDFIRQISR